MLAGVIASPGCGSSPKNYLISGPEELLGRSQFAYERIGGNEGFLLFQVSVTNYILYKQELLASWVLRPLHFVTAMWEDKRIVHLELGVCR